MSLVLNLASPHCCLISETSMVLVFGPFPMTFHLSRLLFDTKSFRHVKFIILGLILPFPKSTNYDTFVTMYISPSWGWTFSQIFEVAPSLYMVELRKSRGDTLEFHKVRMFICFHFWLHSLNSEQFFPHIKFCMSFVCWTALMFTVLQESLHWAERHYLEDWGRDQRRGCSKKLGSPSR